MQLIGYTVHPIFIDDTDHIVKKTYMTKSERENSRLRHYLARLHWKTFCYSRVGRDAETINYSGSHLSAVHLEHDLTVIKS